MSLPPKEKDLVGILNDYEVKIQELEFLVSSQDFDTGSGLIGPQGPQGLTGPAGPSATLTLGSTTTTASGTSASVTNSGTSSAAVLNFSIPRGDKGEKGDTGAAGSAGASASVSVGTTTTGEPGGSALVTNSGTSSNAVLDFTIPTGPQGPPGPTGASSSRLFFLA